MVNRPSTPEIITVNSESLQTQIRDLLPSQNGFGSELQASNVIQPIIDLTRGAEGSGLPSYLQTALSFGSQTTFDVQGTTTTILSLTGFFRITGIVNMALNSSGADAANINLNDGSSDKTIFRYDALTSSSVDQVIIKPFDFNVFLPAGHSVNIVAAATVSVEGSFRQLATGDGTLIEPSGYPL